MTSRINSLETDLKHGRWYYIRWIFEQYQGKMTLIFWLGILTVVSTVVSVLFPLVFKYAIDGLSSNLNLFHAGKIDLVNAEKNRDTLLLVLLILGLGAWITGFYPYLRGRTNFLLEMEFREKYFSEILKKGHNFFLEFRTGDLVTRLSEDVRTFPPGLSWLCCSGIFRALNSSCVVFFCLLSMLFLNWKLTLLAVLPLPLLLAVFFALETTIESRFKKLQKGISEANDFLESVYSGIKIVKSFTSEDPLTRRFESLMERRFKLEIDLIRVEGLLTVFFQFLNQIGQILVIFFGGMMVIWKEITIGEYYAFFSYLGMIVFPLIDIPMLFVTLAQCFVAIDRLEEISRFEKIENVPPPGLLIERIDLVELKNVCFSFHRPKKADTKEQNDKKPFSLRNIEFQIRRGEKLAIVGRIGAGKTTLLNLLAGIFSPESGEFLINGKNAKEIDWGRFRMKIGYVQQDPVIFSETVKFNIDFLRDRDSDWLENCARLAQIDQEIKRFPHGYEEKIGQRGVTLSGGQRQRLSIARALAGNPELLLLDDMTSSLDAENERKLWVELTSHFPNITCLVVTHRLSSAQNADRIMVLSEGAIDAIGTHRELRQTNAIYKELTEHRI